MKMVDVESGSGTLDIRAVVLTADKFEDMELFVPYFRLLDAGARVRHRRSEHGRHRR